MVEEAGFRGVIEFFGRLGVYDVVLPFLLIFTIVFAILEKTKVLGTEKVGEKEITKKNLNSMVAFVVALLVVASTRLVAVVNEVMANIVLLLILAISFLLLVGTFFGSKEFTLEKHPNWIRFFMGLMFLGIVVIFLEALDWLHYVVDLIEAWDKEWAVTIIFLIIVIGFIFYITGEPHSHTEEKKEH